METFLGWKIRFLFLPAVLSVGVFGDLCKVTHQGNATTYNILNPISNAEREYSWADSNDVLATDTKPNNGSISSSHSSLTLLGCRKNVCVETFRHPKHHTTCCYTDCTAAPEHRADFPAATEPPERIDPTTSSPALAVFWTPEVTGVIMGGIVVVIAMVIAVVCCRKKISSVYAASGLFSSLLSLYAASGLSSSLILSTRDADAAALLK
ncbi:unnamed protein product [Arctogadus glacialis]